MAEGRKACAGDPRHCGAVLRCASRCEPGECEVPVDGIQHEEGSERIPKIAQTRVQPLTPAVAAALHATEDAWHRIEQEFGLLSAAHVSQLLGARTTNHNLANEMRARGELFGVQRRNQYLYPGFQFDAQNGTVWPWVKPLHELASDEGVAAEDVLLWMVHPTTYLGVNEDGTAPRPVDVVDNARLLLSVAARAWDARR